MLMIIRNEINAIDVSIEKKEINKDLLVGCTNRSVTTMALL